MTTTTTTRIEATKQRRCETLGSARGLACTFRRPRRNARRAVSTESETHVLKSLRWRGRHRQTRETRALPGINRRILRIRLKATGRRNGCHTWARFAWLASGRCPRLLHAPGSSTCLSRDRQCQNKEAPSDRASRNTTSLTNDPADRVAAAGKTFLRAQD